MLSRGGIQGMLSLLLASIIALGPGDGCRLTDNLFGWYDPEETLDEPDAALYPEEDLAVVETAMARLRVFEPITQMPGHLFFEESISLQKRQGLEQTAAALSDDPGYRSAVADYLADASILYEWEGMHEGPLAEAEYAERFLSGHPGTVIEPFLVVFLLHRYRAAWECATVRGDTTVAAEALAAFTGHYGRVAQIANPVLSLVARELKEASCVYMYGDFPDWPR
jgi:hypothetical protein